MSSPSKPVPKAPDGPDVLVALHGTIATCRPETPLAQAWLDEHCPDSPDRTYWGSALVVEWRYLSTLIQGMQQDGLHVQVLQA